MADIFMSYTKKDCDVVSRLADMLKSVGWSVWWDHRIPAGQTWRSVLDKELQSMRCMVVLWSSHSVESEWVSEEAAEGRNLGRLLSWGAAVLAVSVAAGVYWGASQRRVPPTPAVALPAALPAASAAKPATETLVAPVPRGDPVNRR